MILGHEPMALNVMNNFITDEMKYFTSRTLVLGCYEELRVVDDMHDSM